MPRAKRGFKARRRRNRTLKLAEGYVAGRRRLIRMASEAVDRALADAFVGRKHKKRNYRALWQARISAASKAQGISYSRLIGSLSKKRVTLDRKMLAWMAVSAPADFSAVVTFAKTS